MASAVPAPVPSSRDYISSVANFETDSIPLRLDYERGFLSHRKALSTIKKTMHTNNAEVFGEDGLRARLAKNHTINPPRERRALEVARDNAKLVEKLTEISFKNHSATTHQILERNKRVVNRVTVGSLNDHIRHLEKERIEQDNFGLASRLLSNKSQYEPKNFKPHMELHQYLLKSKSRSRAIRMKTSPPGYLFHGVEAKRALIPNADTSNLVPPSPTAQRNNMAELNSHDEYAKALRSFSSQQRALGYGLPGGGTGTLPPIPRASESELTGNEEQWLEAHQSDLAYQKEVNTHKPKVRQSHTINPREALHVPLSKHYHHQGLVESENAKAKQLAKAFEALETTLVVPRTRLDPNTGMYEISYVDLKDARPDEQHLAQTRPAAEVAAMQQMAELERQKQQAYIQYQYQQQAIAMYNAYMTHMASQSQLQPSASEAESKEAAAAASSADDPSAQEPQPYSFEEFQQLLFQQQQDLLTKQESQPIINADGSVHAPPVWPFGGTILPPHLQPPSADEPSSPTTNKRHLAKKSASKGRGRGGRQIFQLRKVARGGPDMFTPPEAAKSATKSKSPQKQIPRAPTGPAPANSARDTTRYSAHVQSIEAWGGVAGGTIHSPSKSKTVPTISASLQVGTGVPTPAFPNEAEHSHFMNSTSAHASALQEAQREQKEQKAEEDRKNSPRKIVKPVNIAPGSTPTGSSAGATPSGATPSKSKNSSRASGKKPIEGPPSSSSLLSKSSSTASTKSSKRSISAASSKDELEPVAPPTLGHSESDEQLRREREELARLREQADAEDEEEAAAAKEEPNQDEPNREEPSQEEPKQEELKDAKDDVDGKAAEGTEKEESSSSETAPPKGPIQPIVANSASVPEKVEAFEKLSKAHEPTPPSEPAPRSRRGSHKVSLDVPTPNSTASLTPSSSTSSMIQIPAGTSKRSSLQNIPAGLVSSSVAARASRRASFDPNGQVKMKEELDKVAQEAKEKEEKEAEETKKQQQAEVDAKAAAAKAEQEAAAERQKKQEEEEAAAAKAKADAEAKQAAEQQAKADQELKDKAEAEARATAEAEAKAKAKAEAEANAKAKAEEEAAAAAAAAATSKYSDAHPLSTMHISPSTNELKPAEKPAALAPAAGEDDLDIGDMSALDSQSAENSKNKQAPAAQVAKPVAAEPAAPPAATKPAASALDEDFDLPDGLDDL